MHRIVSTWNFQGRNIRDGIYTPDIYLSKNGGGSFLVWFRFLIDQLNWAFGYELTTTMLCHSQNFDQIHKPGAEIRPKNYLLHSCLNTFNYPMGICKLVSENWTKFCFIAHQMAFEKLSGMGKVIFLKSQFWRKIWWFYVRTNQKAGAKISELIRDMTKIIFANEYLGLEFFADGNLDPAYA